MEIVNSYIKILNYLLFVVIIILIFYLLFRLESVFVSLKNYYPSLSSIDSSLENINAKTTKVKQTVHDSLPLLSGILLILVTIKNIFKGQKIKTKNLVKLPSALACIKKEAKF